jgi:hypothetical protein
MSTKTKKSAAAVTAPVAPVAPVAPAQAATQAQKAKLPRTKQFGVHVAKLTRRTESLKKALAHHGTATAEVVAQVVLVLAGLANARKLLDAMPDDALKKSAGAAPSSGALVIGAKVVLTDRAKESFKEILSAEEIGQTFEVIAVAGSTLRVKTSSGATLFLKRGKLAPAPTATPAPAEPKADAEEVMNIAAMREAKKTAAAK